SLVPVRVRLSLLRFSLSRGPRVAADSGAHVAPLQLESPAARAAVSMERRAADLEHDGRRRDRRRRRVSPRRHLRRTRNAATRFAPALAAVAAALPLCLPAYSASIMVNDQLTGVLEHTVLGTVQLLADRGYWQIGVVVLIAGVFIPAVELVGLAWLLARVRFPS